MQPRRCLVVDDDRIAATFLVELIASQGLLVDTARTTMDADLLLMRHPYELLLVDRRLPDGDGVRWLNSLLVGAGNVTAPQCLMMSGDLIDAADLPSGVRYLRKPIDPETVCGWLADRPARPVDARGEAPSDHGESGESIALLDDAAALARFAGNRDALRALRAMLLNELADSSRWRLKLRAAAPSADAMDALHRLRAACALTGCPRLGQASGAIEDLLRRGSAAPAQALDEFDGVIATTMAAISR